MRTIHTDLASARTASSLVFPQFSIPQPDADPAIDLTFIAGDGHTISACLLARPTILCHRLAFTPGLPPLARLSLSRSLMAFAQGYALNRQFTTSGCLFQVADSNLPMVEFARTLGGLPHPGSTLYRIDHR